MTRVQVLAIPVYKRFWLWHTCSGAQQRVQPAPWQSGTTLGERSSLLAAGLKHKVCACNARASGVLRRPLAQPGLEHHHDALD